MEQTATKFCVGDIVIIKIDSSRNEWPLAKVIEVYPDDMGYVRQVKFKGKCEQDPGND